MSWLSSLTGIHISAPDPIKKLGDLAGSLISKAIPGGSVVAGALGIGGTGNGGTNLQTLAQQTGANLQQQGNAAVLAAQQTGAQQQGSQQLAAGIGSLLASPMGIVALLAFVILLVRRR